MRKRAALTKASHTKYTVVGKVVELGPLPFPARGGAQFCHVKTFTQMRQGISENKTAAPQKKLKNYTSAFHTCKNLQEIALCFSSYLGYQANHCQDRTRALQV
jgi:hypothetical protein